MHRKTKMTLCPLLALAACALLFFAQGALGAEYDAYHLMDVSGARDGHTIAGPQWFVTYWDVNGLLRTRGAPLTTAMDAYAHLPDRFSSIRIFPASLNRDHNKIQSIFLVNKADQKAAMDIDFYNWSTLIDPTSDPTPSVMADIEADVAEHATQVTPSTPQSVESEAALSVDVTFRAELADYRSTMGYLTFRQSLNGSRQSILIPIVVADVYDGTAADESLIFDMTVVDSGGGLVTRKKFTWGAEPDNPKTQALGNFFAIFPADAAIGYNLRTRVTNRTGTSYRVQRYDEVISPDSWAYDLGAEEISENLPASFQLDPLSQIAPGLVTNYNIPIADKLRLYSFGDTRPADLTLTYRVIGGMTPYGETLTNGTIENPYTWNVTAFQMKFADQAGRTTQAEAAAADDGNTEDEIAAEIGGTPVMPDITYAFTADNIDMDYYFGADRYSAFMISADTAPAYAAPLAADEVPLLPLRVRIRLSKNNPLISAKWNDAAAASDILNWFTKYGALWLRSPNTRELDLNLFEAVVERDYSVGQCVQAFVDDSYLYLDVNVLLADAKSGDSGKTAQFRVVEDDSVPYILVSDGKADGAWTLGFFAAKNTSSLPDNNSNNNTNNSSGKKGGGGCQTELFSLLLLVPALAMLRKRP
ncbi:MAG: hypothetical protein LBR38_02850 [Synergistaceae bacterium]|jgi:hypothetical protein|nr:hypothetical protein [Synergistaceae bacterium]